MASLGIGMVWSPSTYISRTSPGLYASSSGIATQASVADHKDRKHSSQQLKKSSSNTQKKQKSSITSSLNRKRDFEDGMMIWDDVFEKCCEEEDRVSELRRVAELGLEKHGRGCVILREVATPVSKGAGTGFMGRSRPLGKSGKPSFYKSVGWSVQYVPRTFILDPKLAPEEEGTKDVEGDGFRLIGRTDLMSLLRGMDRTRVLSLTSERLMKDSITARSVQLNEEDDIDAGGEEPYRPSKQELVLLLLVDFDGTPSVGADVLQAQVDGDRWKLVLREFQLFE